MLIQVKFKVPSFFLLLLLSFIQTSSLSFSHFPFPLLIIFFPSPIFPFLYLSSLPPILRSSLLFSSLSFFTHLNFLSLIILPLFFHSPFFSFIHLLFILLFIQATSSFLSFFSHLSFPSLIFPFLHSSPLSFTYFTFPSFTQTPLVQYSFYDRDYSIGLSFFYSS